MKETIKIGNRNHNRFMHNIRLIPLFTTILGILLLIFSLSSLLSGRFMYKNNDYLGRIAEEIQIRISLSNSGNNLRAARLHLVQAATAVRKKESNEANTSFASATRRIQAAKDAFNAYMQRSVKTPADISLEDTMNVRFNAYINNGLLPMMEIAKTGDIEKVANFELDVVNQLDSSYNEFLLKSAAARLLRADELNKLSGENTITGISISAISVVISFIVTLMTFFILKNVVIDPLKKIGKQVSLISQGKLASSDQQWGRGDIGLLGSDIQTMKNSLAETVSSVRDGVISIYQGSSEIANGNNDLSSRTEEQASALQQTAASMEQLTSTVKQNAENAHFASKVARQASEEAASGNIIVNNVMSTMDKISGSSKRISEITSLINSIAFQTNILALNAAVEAARAGEQGRGFAVVASEVRSLAQRSALAVKEIESLIDESLQLVNEGSSEAKDAGNAMSGILESINKVTNVMTDIAAASHEQSRGIEQISQAVTQMDSVTQQNAALVEEASSAAASLEEQASHLERSVSVFQLPDEFHNQQRISNQPGKVVDLLAQRSAVIS